MIVILAKTVLLEGKQAEFLAVAEKLVKATREEPGCIYYDLAQDMEDEKVFYLVEKYMDDAAVEAHNASAHFQTYVPMMNALRSDSEVKKYVMVDF